MSQPRNTIRNNIYQALHHLQSPSFAHSRMGCKKGMTNLSYRNNPLSCNRPSCRSSIWYNKNLNYNQPIVHITSSPKLLILALDTQTRFTRNAWTNHKLDKILYCLHRMSTKKYSQVLQHRKHTVTLDSNHLLS